MRAATKREYVQVPSGHNIPNVSLKTFRPSRRLSSSNRLAADGEQGPGHALALKGLEARLRAVGFLAKVWMVLIAAEIKSETAAVANRAAGGTAGGVAAGEVAGGAGRGAGTAGTARAAAFD